MVCPCDGNMMRWSRVLIQKSIHVPFVVSLSNHERRTLKFLTLRQAQGERILSRDAELKTGVRHKSGGVRGTRELARL
jgi:hypothetical protein